MAETFAPGTIGELLRQAAAAHPDRDAVAMVDRTVSYAELERETARFGRALIAAGAGKGTRIALMAPDGIAWLVAFIGALRIGALVAAVSTLCKPPEIAYILRNCDAWMLIGVRHFLNRDYAAALVDALPDLAREPAGNLRLPGAPFLRTIVLDDAEGLAWACSHEQLIAGAPPSTAREAALFAAVEAEVTPADLATILYTSGSTALPKAVVHRQRTLVRKSLALAECFHIAAEDRMMPTLPVFWVGGMAMALMVLARGGTLVYPIAPDDATTVETIAALGVTRVNSWGPRHRKLVGAALARGIDVERIGGLATPRDPLGGPIHPARFANLLGMSESFSAHSGQAMNKPLPITKAGASGRAIDGIERRVIDPDTGAILGADEVGELQIRGATMMDGFYKTEPGDVFTPDGFYSTGDLVRIDGDGYLFFVARRGDFIKTSGANVSRLEVEQAILAIPGVSLAVVTGLPDGELGERIIAAVLPDGSAPLGEQAIREQLLSRLSSYKVPRRIVLIGQDDVAWTNTGTKIDMPRMRDIIARLAA